MAEFKISRIRYTWKGNWNTLTAYRKDDVVRYGGSSWVCIRLHTSSTFVSDQTFLANPADTESSPAWTKMTDGRSYRNTWNPSTLYNVGDVIKYGGNLYLVVNSFTSSSVFDTDLNKLSTYAELLNWRNEWTTNTRYGIGDLVRYGGQVYKCVQGHTSSNISNGPEIGNNDAFEDSTLETWEIYYSNIVFTGQYSDESVRYRINDLVLFGGSILRCIESYTSDFTFDSSKWELEADGNEFNGDWQDSVWYGRGSVVRYGGWSYVALSANYNTHPVDSIYQSPASPPWRILSKGYNLVGDYDRTQQYETGDVIRRGGILYRAKLDIIPDGSSLEYLDDSNWEIINESINFRGPWDQNGVTYRKNDVVTFLGSLYKANTEHDSDTNEGFELNSPGDNGNGIFYWDLLLETKSRVGMTNTGDLLTFGLSRNLQGDTSTLGPTNVPIGAKDQLLIVSTDDNLRYQTYGKISRVFYVDKDGIDDTTDTMRGNNPFKPWKTVRFACENADDGFEGFTTIRVSVGQYDEILPIIIPARTVVWGSELRSTSIKAAGPIEALQNDSSYTIAILQRFSLIVPDLLRGNEINPPKSATNQFNPVIVLQEGNPAPIADQAILDAQARFQNIVDYINANLNSLGGVPTMAGSNEATEDIGYQNAVEVLEANIPFFQAEAVAFMQEQYPEYNFVPDLCKRDVDRYIRALIYDLTFLGNYKSIMAARYYVNAVLGSKREDMFYCRDSTGIRNCTLLGLEGTISPPNVFDLYQRPTGGAYTSLDPGWGPADRRTWIVNRSPYIQGVTNIGDRCVGIKIDGALHNGGNKSMVANDYTQVLSDGIGAWALNNGRTELVSVFTYYCTIGYFAKDGGVIRGTNGNCSYGNYGAISDGVDPTEVPLTASVNTRTNEAIVYQALSGEFTDEITVLEYRNAGQSYTQATAEFIGAGVNAEVVFEDFRDNAVFEARLIDVLPSAVFVASIEGSVLTVTSVISGVISTGYVISGIGVNTNLQIVGFGSASGGVGTYNLNQNQTLSSRELVATTTNLIAQYVGGGGYSLQQNQAQVHSTPNGDLTSITIASNDTNLESDYLGKRIIITSGTGTGQYAYISAYDSVTKVVSVTKESNDQPGWDHVIPGRPIANPLDTTTRYRIEPRVIFSQPQFNSQSVNVPVTATYNEIAYGETTETYGSVIGDSGTGTVIPDDGLVPVVAIFSVTKIGRSYSSVTIVNPGAGYAVGDIIVLEGNLVGGATPDNDITITVTETTDDSTNQILDFTYEGLAASGKFVAVPDDGNQAIYSANGETWFPFNLPAAGNWKCLAAGDNKFVAIQKGTNVAATSFNGINWTLRTMPESRDWNSVVYGGGKFVAIASDQNSSAYSTDGINWISSTLPTIGDSSLNEWVDIAYGKGLYVAIANSGNHAAYSNDGITWQGTIMDVIDDSSQKDWVSVAYGNNRFVAISEQGDVGFSFDGITWFPATMPTEDGSTAHSWYKIRYAQGIFFAVGDTGSKIVGADPTLGPTRFAATSEDGIVWTGRVLTSTLSWRSIGFGNPFIAQEDSTLNRNTPMWIAAGENSSVVNKISVGARAKGRAYVSAGQINQVTIFDPGSGYTSEPTVTLVDPSATSDAGFEVRTGDGVLTNPEWINRGIGYRTRSTNVIISGDGFADSYVLGKNIRVDNLSILPGPGAQVTFAGNPTRYVLSTITQISGNNGSISANLRLGQDIKVRDNLSHGTVATIQLRVSQVRLTGHDFLDIGTGNFTQTNYPEIYTLQNYVQEPEAEVYEEDGGRVFYTSTDQTGNFRTGELFAVEQATGIVTISADFFDLEGLSELRLGGIRVGGTGAVIREFSTDALFTADSNNIVPTQRAIRAFLENRLTVGGSEIATSSFIAGLVRVGPTSISSTLSGTIVFLQRADFTGEKSAITGKMLAQSFFLRTTSPD